MLINDLEGLRRAVKGGAGWRADCLGDLGGFSKKWNHMKDMYRQQIERAEAGAAWESAPVAFETCWDMRKWKAEGWDIRWIFDYALDLHGSYVNNKSAPIPEGTRPEVERLLRKLGYRLVLRKAHWPRRAAAGRSATVSLAFENVGVAPPYRDARLRLRLRTADGSRSCEGSARTSIRGWKPGKADASATIDIPADFPAGVGELALGVVNPASFNPEVCLAIAGRAADGWYPLGTMEVGR